MIEVKIRQGDIYSLQLKGHAGYAPAGSDIVCAACTILAYVAAHCALNAYEEGCLEDEPAIHMDEGDIRIEATPYGDWLIETWMALEQTYRLIAHTYPQNVKVYSGEYAEDINTDSPTETG